jgi:hypothetical protein
MQVVIEQCFGYTKGKFRVLTAQRFDPDAATTIFQVCLALCAYIMKRTGYDISAQSDKFQAEARLLAGIIDGYVGPDFTVNELWLSCASDVET